jgi:hypothetical protein
MVERYCSDSATEGEPALVNSGGVAEVADRWKVHDRGLAPREQVNQDGDGRGEEPQQRPGRGEGDHVTAAERTSACFRAVPKGWSVVITS